MQAAENECFLCTWAPAAFDKADTWVSWTIQLQNHRIIIAEKYDLWVNAKISPIMRCRSCLCRQTDPGLFVQPCGEVCNGIWYHTVVSTYSIHVDNSSCWHSIWLPAYHVDKMSDWQFITHIDVTATMDQIYLITHISQSASLINDEGGNLNKNL